MQFIIPSLKSYIIKLKHLSIQIFKSFQILFQISFIAFENSAY